MPELSPLETEFRSRYGVPADVEHVLIFAESSHWDPNWLQTSGQYFSHYVESNLLQAVAELERQPRRVYSVECMFFLRLFWDKHTELHDKLRSLVKEKRLLFTSSGVTSADTLLPDAEAILRDLLLGQEWLRQNGLEAEPLLAYFPDCFGHTPALPSLLNAAGFTMTAFARIDGMSGMGADYDPKSSYPRQGSNAETLQKKEKTLDFIWRAPDGSQLLSHWNAFSYFQGDLIGYRGFMRAYLFPSFMYPEDRSDKNLKRRMQGYINELAPFSRTPYLFCPIGMDFNAPVPDLLELLDRYNQKLYAETGVWAVNAGLEDYLSLVGCYSERLPVLELDPNPYWTGFYTSRPTLKQRSHTLLKQLELAERLSVAAGIPLETSREKTNEAWWALATSNHHDFITGTSPDATVEGEQIPMLEQALAATRPLVERMKTLAEPRLTPAAAVKQPQELSWEQHKDKIVVTTAAYNLEINAAVGGCITRLWDPASGEPLLAGISNELLDYRESGGLWRMGMEYRGGKYKLVERSGSQPARLEIHPLPGALEISTTLTLSGQPIRCAMLFRGDSPWVRFRITGRAAEGHTLCTRFTTGLTARTLAMENPGGIAVRPPHKIYQPTYWPVQHFFHLQNDVILSGSPERKVGAAEGLPQHDVPHKAGRGLAFLLALPAAAAYYPDQQAVELVALRNATREKAYGFIPILATPADGHEKEDFTFQFALCFTQSGGWQENRLPQQARDYAQDPWSAGEDSVLYQRLRQEVSLSSDQVWLETLKPAWRGEGLIARLCSFTLPQTPVKLSVRGRDISLAFACDTRQRDLHPLEVHAGEVTFTPRQTITTLRLLE